MLKLLAEQQKKQQLEPTKGGSKTITIKKIKRKLKKIKKKLKAIRKTK